MACEDVFDSATCSRVMQFRSGPGHYTFYACTEHAHYLEQGDVPCFFATTDEPVKPGSPGDDNACVFCQEGGGDLGEDCLSDGVRHGR